MSSDGEPIPSTDICYMNIKANRPEKSTGGTKIYLLDKEERRTIPVSSYIDQTFSCGGKQLPISGRHWIADVTFRPAVSNGKTNAMIKYVATEIYLWTPVNVNAKSDNIPRHIQMPEMVDTMMDILGDDEYEPYVPQTVTNAPIDEKTIKPTMDAFAQIINQPVPTMPIGSLPNRGPQVNPHIQGYPPQNIPTQNYPPQIYQHQNYPPQNYPPQNYHPQNIPTQQTNQPTTSSQPYTAQTSYDLYGSFSGSLPTTNQ